MTRSYGRFQRTGVYKLSDILLGEIYGSLYLIHMFQKLGLSEHGYKLTVLCCKCLISFVLKNMISKSLAFILPNLSGNQTYIPLNSNT